MIGMEEVPLSSIQALSSEEISTNRKPRNKELPSRGFKEYAPDGSWIEKKRLEKAYENTREVIAEAKVNTLGSLIVGEWLRDQRLVQVVNKGKGPFWRYMGHSESKKDYLFPEEALFLMDSGAMEVNYGGMPLCVKQAYGRLLGDTCITIAEYQVYAHLMRQGYIVTRYNPGSGAKITKYEKKLGLDHHISKKQRKKEKKDGDKMADVEDGSPKKRRVDQGGGECSVEVKRPKASSNLDSCPEDIVRRPDLFGPDHGVEESISGCAGGQSPVQADTESILTDECDSTAATQCAEFENTTAARQCTDSQGPGCHSDDKEMAVGVVENSIASKTIDSSSDHVMPELVEHENPSHLVNDMKNSQEWSEKLPYSKWNFSDFSFLSLTDEESEFTKPASSLLPENIDLVNCSFHLQRFQPSSHARLEKIDKSMDSEFSCGDAWNQPKPNRSSARNWCEYKQERLQISKEENDVENTPVSYLWRSDVTPLLLPYDAKSTAHIMEKIQVIKSKPWPTDQKATKDCPVDGVRIAFDVYTPDMKASYRKSAPPLPNYRICILGHRAPPPDLAMINYIVQQTGDDVPILWAMSDFGDIHFFLFSPVEMPIDVNIG